VIQCLFTTGAATVAAALEEYRAGQLVEAGSTDVKDHWV